ncbi:MAG: hypothetical protein ACR2M6_02555 [Vampirovibrionia bacterium]
MKSSKKIVEQLRKAKILSSMREKLVPNTWNEFGEKESEANRSQIFSILREMLFTTSTYWNNNTLADALNITPQRCSLYASGSDRQASWWAIMRLCQILNKKIVLTSTEVRIEDDT